MLQKKIETDLVTAMKAKAAEKVSTLRMAKAAVLNRAIELSQDTLEDAETIAVLTKMVKQREESIKAFTEGGRQELAEKEAAEIEFLKVYLPEPLSQDALKALVQEAIAETGASAPSDMGKVMQAVMPKLNGRADGKMVNQVVKDLLA